MTIKVEFIDGTYTKYENAVGGHKVVEMRDGSLEIGFIDSTGRSRLIPNVRNVSFESALRE